MTSQEVYIHYSPEVFTDDGEVTNESTKEFLRNYLAEAGVWPRRGDGSSSANSRRGSTLRASANNTLASGRWPHQIKSAPWGEPNRTVTVTGHCSPSYLNETCSLVR